MIKLVLSAAEGAKGECCGVVDYIRAGPLVSSLKRGCQYVYLTETDQFLAKYLHGCTIGSILLSIIALSCVTPQTSTLCSSCRRLLVDTLKS
jgi:hypothetical protein